eukprot:TRINITY_DN364_c0_g1_i1.p1 TRINITY_DN364_c0_g1~~TRINITY_DN364_c0_g1_i1.p1  ORF type:complete len:898 (-),score=136.13 TRINITY_DN364_c0_g1_i1:3490-6183(-)
MSTPRWETQKENIQPRPRGRNVKLLEKVFVGTKEDIEAERIRRENAVKDAVERNEPANKLLDVYLAYALFIVDYYPSGSKYLIRAVEDPCRRHAKDEFFRDDIRFLRLWILYIEMRKDKLEVFSYMRRKRIGYSWTLFYEAWAATLEAARQYDKVKEVYLLAKEVNSHPQHRIEQREREFESRMAARKKRDQQKKLDIETKKIESVRQEAARNERNTDRAEPSLASTILSAPASSSNDGAGAERSRRVRPALGEISEREAITGLRPFTSRPLTSSATVHEQKQPQSNQFRTEALANKENKFQIYRDHSKTDPKSELAHDHEMPFEIMAKIDEVGKEDRGCLPSQWAGETLPQNTAAIEKLKKRSMSARQMGSFQIYQDEGYQRGGFSEDRLLDKSSSPLAEDDVANDHENIPVPSPEAARREPSPTFSQREDGYNRPPSPTINTKIAMREIDDMFNSSFPSEQPERAKCSLLPGASSSLGNAEARKPAPLQVLQDQEPSRHSRYNETRMASTTHHSAKSSPVRYDELELERYLKMWAVDQPCLQFIGDANVDIEPDSVQELPWRVPVTLCVQESYCHGYSQRSRVFFVEDVDNEFGEAELSSSSADDEGDVPLLVLKQSGASNIWEFYIYQTIQQRFQKKLIQTDSIPFAVGFSQGREMSFLVLDTKGVSSLTRVLQMMPSNVLPEALAMLMTVDLLKTLCLLHEINIIHSDVTLDNVLFRRDTGVELVADEYNASGEKGWSACGVLLIDYNNSIDVLHERVGGTQVDDVVRCTSNCRRSTFDQEYHPSSSGGWAFNVDCYGAAVCAAKMLGVELSKTNSGPVPLKHEKVWKSFFGDVMQLEPLSSSSQTVELMRRTYESMERILVEQEQTLGIEVRRLFRAVAFALEADADTTRKN